MKSKERKEGMIWKRMEMHVLPNVVGLLVIKVILCGSGFSLAPSGTGD